MQDFKNQAAVDWQAWDEGRDTQIPASIICHRLTEMGGCMTRGLADYALLPSVRVRGHPCVFNLCPIFVSEGVV